MAKRFRKCTAVFQLALGVALSACSNATPTLTSLPSTIPGPLFGGRTTAEDQIFQLASKLEFDATCDARITKWQYSLDGSTWNDFSQIADQGSSTACSNQTARFVLSPAAFGFAAGPSDGVSESRTMRIRGITSFGVTEASTMSVTYTRYPLLKAGSIASGAAIQSGSESGTRYVIRGTVSGFVSEKTLADSSQIRRIQLSREK